MALPSEIPPTRNPRGRAKLVPREGTCIHAVRLSHAVARRLERIVAVYARSSYMELPEARNDVLAAIVETGVEMLENRLCRAEPAIWRRISAKAYNAACGAEPGLSWRDHDKGRRNPHPVPLWRFK